MQVSLRNGLAVEIRQIRPQDKRNLAAAYARLSPEAQRLRFLAPKPRLSNADLRYLTELDGHDHVALVAVLAGDPEAIIGVARFVRLRDQPETAEFAIVVGDPYQGSGLGSLLSAGLAELARKHGVARFTATVLADNDAVQRLIEVISTRLEYVGTHDGVREVVAELAA